MTVGRPARLAWSLAGACVALVLSSLVLLLAVSHAWDVSQYYFEDAAVAVAFALLGAVVAAHRPENPIGWLFLAIGLSGALGVVSNEYVRYTLVTAPDALPGGSVAAWLSGWTWWPAYGLVPLVLLVFPDGRLPSPRWRWAAWLAGAGVAVMTLGMAASTLGDPVRIALSEEEPGGLPGLVLDVSVIAAAASFLAALVSLAQRWRRARGNEREQLKWVAFAAGLALVANIVLQIFQLPGLGLVGVVLVPVGAAVAILRYRLYDIDRIISRTLGYGLLTPCSGWSMWLGCSCSAGCSTRVASPPGLLWPPPPWPWLHCSSRPAAGFRPPLTAASTGPAMTRPGPWPRSVPACATRSTWTPSPPSCWRSWTRPWSRPRSRSGFDLPHPAPPT
jgi:hypothetical protein